jgi:hypothetical protein
MASQMMCDNCREEVEEGLIRRGDKVYCCEACAFEASRSADCGGRTDSPIGRPIVDRVEIPNGEVNG